MEAYIVEVEKDGKKYYYEHDCYFPIEKPNHRCLLGDVKSAKAKRTKLSRCADNEGANIKIREASITIGEEIIV